MAANANSILVPGRHGPVTLAIQAAEKEHQPNRRWLLAGLAALPFVPRPARGADAHPDARLVALGALLDEAWEAEMQAASAEGDGEFQPIFDHSSSIVDEIETLSATTLAGLQVKAKACSWCHDGEPFTEHSFSANATTDARLAAGILSDLLAMGGAA